MIILVGTNRKNSRSGLLASQISQLYIHKGIVVEICDLANLPHDLIESSLYNATVKHPKFEAMSKMFVAHEKVLFIVPEYNGSFPGVLKTFIDGMEYPASFKDKKCALIGHSSGAQGGVFAMSHLTDILNYLGSEVLSLKVKLPTIEKFINEAGEISSKLYNDLLKEQCDRFIKF